MKKSNPIISWIIPLLIALLFYTCESEPECGCDGKKAFVLNNEVGEIYYETESDYATFVSATLYTLFVLCNPEEFRDTLATFDQGTLVYVSGIVHYQCYNNPYTQTSYLLDMTNIIEFKIDD
jgi:hypothetical protein